MRNVACGTALPQLDRRSLALPYSLTVMFPVNGNQTPSLAGRKSLSSNQCTQPPLTRLLSGLAGWTVLLDVALHWPRSAGGDRNSGLPSGYRSADAGLVVTLGPHACSSRSSATPSSDPRSDKGVVQMTSPSSARQHS